jgi:competence protein ComEA
MKAVHLLVVAIFAFTFALSALSGNALAASEKKEVTAAPVDKVKVTSDDKNSATKATKDIPKDVNINTADKEMLILLPGIGPVGAEAILAYRKDNGNFKSVDELTKVKGIGDKTLEKLKPYLQKI